MLSYITTLKPEPLAIKFVYSEFMPTNEYCEIEYIRSKQDIREVSLRNVVDGKSYIAMPVSRHKEVGYIVPDQAYKDVDFELLGWAVISEYDAKKILKRKNQSHLNMTDIAKINGLLFDVLVNTY